jgi:glyoxylase-like metal-dependent hydrolase (beta-lactamase superfamily II)
MRVLALPRSDTVYTANAYLVLGQWSRIEDVNVLVDPGADPAVVPFVEAAPTGIGKRKVDLVVLTHRHYDHASLAPVVRERFGAPVAAWGPPGDDVDRALGDGERLRLGDEEFEVIHSPGHTDDSICLFGLRSGALFVGDTPVVVNGTGATYEPGFVAAIRRIAALPVRTIYFGHGQPLTEGCRDRLAVSLSNVERSNRGGELSAT